mgnify:FL=1
MRSLEPMRIDEAIDAVVDRAKEILVDATQANGLLAGATIIRGDRAKASQSGSNTVWMVPDIATIDHTTQGLAELWNLDIILGAIVKNDNPEEGFLEATRLAAKAQQSLLGRDRRWGLPFVEHVTATRFDPSSPRNSNAKRSLFWADSVITVRFRRLEKANG